jgi:FKBP-type peptidyl-prolyl cis-trans isomerase FkpA
MLKKISSYTLVLLSLIILNSCKKEYESVQSIDDRKIEEYIASNNITNAVKDPSGFYYQVLTQGAGEPFENTDSVLYKVVVKSLLNGTVYYTSPTNSNIGTYVGYANSLLGLNIPGIRIAIASLNAGGTARVILPSYLAFGKNGNTRFGIPPNDLIDVTVTTYPEKSQRLLDDRLIREYLQAKGLTATKDPVSGVYYIKIQDGTGTDPIDLSTTVKANYTGRYLDGTVFETNTDSSFSFSLETLTANWDVLTKFKKGAKVRLFIPSSEAYGTAGSGDGGILPNTILDFDIEIVDVTK